MSLSFTLFVEHPDDVLDAVKALVSGELDESGEGYSVLSLPVSNASVGAMEEELGFKHSGAIVFVLDKERPSEAVSTVLVAALIATEQARGRVLLSWNHELPAFMRMGRRLVLFKRSQLWTPERLALVKEHFVFSDVEVPWASFPAEL